MERPQATSQATLSQSFWVLRQSDSYEAEDEDDQVTNDTFLRMCLSISRRATAIDRSCLSVRCGYHDRTFQDSKPMGRSMRVCG